MSVAENKEIVLGWIAARNSNDLDGFLSVTAEAWHERVKMGFNSMTNAFPDIHIQVEDILGEGDQVVTNWTMTATHSGVYLNVPATHKKISIKGIDIVTIEDGKIVALVRQSDNLGLLKQLGVTFSLEGEVIT